MSQVQNVNITAELIEKELVSVELYTVDFVTNRTVLTELFVKNEVPTPDPPIRTAGQVFTLANEYESGTLQVFLNGLKLHQSDITENSTTTFSYL